MSKEDAIRYLVKIDFANGNTEVEAAIDAAVKKRNVAIESPSEVKEPVAEFA